SPLPSSSPCTLVIAAFGHPIWDTCVNKTKGWPMPWFNIRKHDTDKNEDTPNEAATRPPTSPGARTLPPHRQRLHEELPPRTRNPSADEQRVAFERKRRAIEFDSAQGELAADDDNPWNHRIALLTEALETVKQDQDALTNMPKEPYAPVPPTPITNMD